MPRPEYGGGPNERGRSTGRAHHADHDTEGARGDRRGKDDKDDKDGKDDKGARIDLSVAQVVGAGMATLTAATAASYLNVYGTVIGTAVMAVLSTSATPVIQHWITRSGERAKGLAEKAKQPQAAPFAERPEPAIERDDLGATAAFQESEDATRTMAMPSLGHDLPGRTLAHGFGNPADPDRPHDPVPGEPTELLPSVGPRDRSEAVASDTTGEEGTRPKRGRRAVLIPAGVVFVLVMMVILAFELLTGRSLTAWTQGQDEPTSPSLLGGQSAPAHTDEDEDDEDTDTSVRDQEPQEEGTDTAPGTGTGDPDEPGTTPGDQGTDTPTVPTEPAEPPVEEPEPELPGEPAEPEPGDDEQGGDAPQDGAPRNGTQGEPAPTG